MNNYINELTENDPIFTRSVNSDIQLKQHQLCSLYKCISIENNTFRDDEKYVSAYSNIGIIADKAGSGKSYVILSLISENDAPKNDIRSINVYSEAIYVEYKNINLRYINLNIIVCPFSIVDQWSNYIKTFNKDIKFMIVNTKKSFNEYKEKYTDEYTILLVASTFYYLVEQYLYNTRVKVTRVIFDEADSTPTKSAKKIQSMFYWFVSASYNNIINPYPRYVRTLNPQNYYINRVISSGVYNNVFIKNLFGSLLRNLPYHDKYILNNLIVKNTDDFVYKSFNLPEINQYYIKCVDPVSDLVNYMTTNENIINCVNAGDLTTAISYMNRTNKGDETHIIDILKEDLNKKLKNCQLSIRYHSDIIVDNQETQMDKIRQLEQQEKDILFKIQMMAERIKTGDICTICYSDYKNKTIMKCCKNAFCFECICTWLQVKNYCPFCKANIDDIHNDLYVIDNEVSSEQKIISYKKLDAINILIDKIMNNTKKSKILIFAEYEKPLTDIIPFLKNKKIKYGSVKGISLKGNIEKYKNSDMDVLLINSRAFGSGINLENTTDIIIYHSFNKGVQSQVIGRAQRPGRKEALNVWYLFNNGELDKNQMTNISEYTI